MERTEQATRTRTRWRSQMAGVLLVLVGVANAILGVLALTTNQVLLGTGVAGGLLAAGVVTAAAGVLVWQGNRLVTAVAFAIMAVLLLGQIADLIVGGIEGVVPRLVVMILLVLTLGLAVLEQQRRGRRG